MGRQNHYHVLESTMRVLRFFFQLFILAAIVGVFMYTIGGTVWLTASTSHFLNDVKSLSRLSQKIQQYIPACQEAPGSSENSSPNGFQLRFTDNHHYVIELVCSLIEDTPIQLSEGTLPPFITKDPGSSGFYYSQAEDLTANIQLRSFGKTKVIQARTDKISFPATYDTSSTVPKNTCSGFGYFCCNDQSQTGTGEHRTEGITDCPAQCYATCNTIPFVEFFASDPVANVNASEIAMTTSSLDVTFNYGVQTPDDKVSAVTIDYGDGNTQDASELQGIFVHTFTCDSTCRYKVTLRVTDTKGRTSVENKTGTIYIVRR
jgi:hypothetical protein